MLTNLLFPEIHPYNVQERAAQYARSQGLAVTAYSSFGPLGFRELNTPKSLHAQPLFAHPLITSIAEAHEATPAQIVLRWATQRGLCVIPKSDTVEQMRENLESAKIKLTEEEKAKLQERIKNATSLQEIIALERELNEGRLPSGIQGDAMEE